MIVNFYKRTTEHNRQNGANKFIASKNLDCIPPFNTTIKLNSQTFRVSCIILNIDRCEYDVYLVRT